MYVCIRTYIRMYMRTCKYAYIVYMHVCVYVYIRVCVYIRIHIYICMCVCAVQYGATWFGVSQGPRIGVSAKTRWILSNKIERCFTNKMNVGRQNAGSKVVKRNGVMSREMDGNGVSVQQQNLGSRQGNQAKIKEITARIEDFSRKELELCQC